MKTFEFYEKKNKKLVLEMIKEQLKTGPAKVSVDCTVKALEDLKKPVVMASVRRLWKQMARQEMKSAENPKIILIEPKRGAVQNGIELDPGIVVPVYAAPILDTNEYTDHMMIVGLVVMLSQEKDDYYLKLLKSFDIKSPTPKVQAMLDEKYWDRKGRPRKKYAQV